MFKQTPICFLKSVPELVVKDGKREADASTAAPLSELAGAGNLLDSELGCGGIYRGNVLYLYIPLP